MTGPRNITQQATREVIMLLRGLAVTQPQRDPSGPSAIQRHSPSFQEAYEVTELSRHAIRLAGSQLLGFHTVKARVQSNSF